MAWEEPATSGWFSVMDGDGCCRGATDALIEARSSSNQAFFRAADTR